MNKILVGSTYFFKKFKDFKSKDKDYVRLRENPIGYKYVMQSSANIKLVENPFCLFEWRKMSADDFVEYSLHNGPAMQIGKFLVPEFCKEIGFTIEHLKRLEPLINKLDDRHKYEKIIYESYILNNKFELTEEQLNRAYEAYKKER